MLWNLHSIDRRMLYMMLIRVDARHTACAGLIQRRVPRENAIDMEMEDGPLLRADHKTPPKWSPVVWGANWVLKS